MNPQGSNAHTDGVLPGAWHKRAIRIASAALVLSSRHYAAVCDAGRTEELLSRCAHYLGHDVGAEVVVRTSQGVIRSVIGRDGRPSPPSPSSVWRFVRAAALGRLLVCRDSHRWRTLEKLLYAKLFLIDWRGTYRTVAWRFAASGSDRRAPRPAALDRSTDTVIVLGTGPSAYRIFEDQFAGFDVITCNTAIKSDRLLAERRVVAHCFSDACFFAGSSGYSRAFLDRLARQVTRHDFRIYHDRDHGRLLERVLPPDAHACLHPVEFSPHLRGRHTFAHGCQQAPYGNVLTALMLPLAATFYRRIVLVGFDGKGQTKNYFWAHADEFQFQEELPSVRTSYPCFFSEIDYDRYSEDHNAILDDLCSRIEAGGAEIVMAHHSSLPALAARTRPLALSTAPQLDGGRAA